MTNSSLSALAATSSDELAAARQRIQELEAALAVRPPLFSDVAADLPDGLLLADAQGLIQVVNPAFCRLWDLGGGAAQWVGQPAARLEEELLQRVADPAGYTARSRRVRDAGRAAQNQLLALRDGRVLELDFIPLGNTSAGPAGSVIVYARDATAREEAISQLRLTARIPAQNPSPVLRYDAAGRQVFANPAALRFEELLNAPDLQLLQRRLGIMARRSLSQAQSYRTDIRTGRYLLQAHVTPFAEEQYVNVYLFDITARAEAEQQLREQQTFTELVLDTSPNAVYVRDGTGKVLFANQAMQALLRDMGDMRLRAAEDPNSQAARELAEYARVDAQVLTTGGPVISEDKLTLPTGEVRWFQSRKGPLPRPDGTRHVLGVSTDITDLKEAQLRLEQRAKQYSDLMHYAQAHICTYDLQGHMLSVNPALATMIGHEPAELLGQPLANFLLPDDQPNFPPYLEHIATHGEAKGVLRIQPRHSSELRYLLYHNFVVREDSQPPYIISHSQDITERIAAEKASTLARKEAEATAVARENFLANMSHEIRTPMNGVLGMTRQLAKTRLDPQQLELVRVIQASGQHLLAVLNDVLDMAKITAGKLELEQVPFNLCDSMGAAIQPLVVQAQEKGLEVVGVLLRETCPVPWVLGDPHRLNQILINLMSNAVKFTQRGRITVKGEQVSETADTLTVRFSVQDTGPGVHPDKQRHIFESFTQAYADTSRRHGGTGLGLTISRSLVEQMGGALTLASELGQGSTFAFALTLPKAPPSAIAPPADAPTTYDTGRLRGVRVLMVEDNEINRTVARMMLEPWGVELEEAVDGPAALELLAAQNFDVVLMDIQMPGMSGVEVTEHLRRLPEVRRATTPIIALTANAFRANVESYLAAGMNDYLTKPFEEAELYQKIAALLPAAPARPSYDLTELHRMAQGRTVFVERIIRSFLTNMPGSVRGLREAAAADNWPEVARLVHHVKPNLQALGVPYVAKTVELLESAHHTFLSDAEQPSPAMLKEELAQLLRTIEQALAELPAELARQ